MPELPNDHQQDTTMTDPGQTIRHRLHDGGPITALLRTAADHVHPFTTMVRPSSDGRITLLLHQQFQHWHQ